MPHIPFISPDWTPPHKYVHDWRRYISDEMKSAWDTFTIEQKRMIYESAAELADLEVWD